MKHLEVKNTIFEMKNMLHGIKSKSDNTEDQWIEDTAIETVQSKKTRDVGAGA